jgi:hypothetical protein
MEYRGSGLPARDRRSELARRELAHPEPARPDPSPREPSWPTVIATTLRLWFQRHPLLGKRATRRRRLIVLVVALAVIGAVAADIATVMSRSTASSVTRSSTGSSASGTSGSALGASATARDTAAKWVADQVAPSAVVACDPAMCTALEADQVPASRLLVLGPASADPLGSDLVIATMAVRNEFGSRLAGVYAPEVIATFGSGAGQIDVRATAPDGAAAYRSSLAADLSSRVSAGQQLLRNQQLTVDDGAKPALNAGDVDSRLLTLLAGVAAEQPLTVHAFGDPSPGVSASVPLRSVRISPRVSAAKAKARLQSMLSFVKAQQQPYQPLRVTVSGTSLIVEFAAPSPLGLLSGA